MERSALHRKLKALALNCSDDIKTLILLLGSDDPSLFIFA
jgi:hypothetical protein